jgi:signal transduction histidine kinase
LKHKYYIQAKQIATEALQTDSSSLTNNLLLYENLIIANAALGDMEQAQNYIQLFKNATAEYSNENFQSSISEMEVKYETEKKELEIERQQMIIRRQNTLRILFLAGISLFAMIALMLWYMLGLRNRRNRALTELNNALDERNDALAGLNNALTERNDALAEINSTKDKFFNIISHDIKNPAVAQRDALKILVQNAARWDADRLEVYLNGLLETADGQVELIYNLLSWAQLQTGRMVFSPAAFNLAAALRSDITLIRGMAEKKNISLIANIPPDADITGDSNMLATAVRNLLSNAVKFTPAGGTVTLDIKRANLSADADLTADADLSTRADLSAVADTARTDLQPARLENTDPADSIASTAPEYTISITDTGIGMTADQIAGLFRLDSVHSRLGTAGEQGSGLGLTVCRELLEKHGSTLHVESAPGAGSRFWFRV